MNYLTLCRLRSSIAAIVIGGDAVINNTRRRTALLTVFFIYIITVLWYTVFKRNITSIVTGYYKDGEWIWKNYFRPIYDFSSYSLEEGADR